MSERKNRNMHSGMEHEMPPSQTMQGMQHGSSAHSMHIEMFKRRFFVCLILTIPVLLLSQII